MNKSSYSILLLSFLYIGCGSGPKPMRFPCWLGASEFLMRAKDTLEFNKFNITNTTNTEIETSKTINDGMSNRTVYLRVQYDSLASEATMFVRTIVKFRGDETEIFFDEKPRFTNDFRFDFKPTLNALRAMCTPPPKKKRKTNS